VERYFNALRRIKQKSQRRDGKMRDGLDDGMPSTFSDAKESLESAVNHYADSVREARVKYESMGAKWSDLPDGQDEEKNMAALLRAAGPAGSQ